MKRALTLFLIVAALMGVTVPVHAEEQVANFFLLYDLDATAITYCRVTNLNGDPFGLPITVTLGKLKTSGSSVTVVDETASTNVFAAVAVGDILVVNTGVETTKYGVVVAKGSDASLTIHAAQNWSAGYTFGILRPACGTAATSGWIDLPSKYENKVIGFHLKQINGVTGGIDLRVECKGGYADAAPNPVYPSSSTATCGGGTNASGFCNFTTAGITTGNLDVQVDEAHRSCRVGLLIHTSETAESVEADNERITVGLTLTTNNK